MTDQHPMTDNSRQLLDAVLKQTRQEQAPNYSEQDYFMTFCAEQILKNFQLADDELQAGIVDGEHDGGIDAAYTFVNNQLVHEDFDTSNFKKNHVQIELHLIQVKTSGGFKESAINCLISATRHLLDLNINKSDLTQYNESVKAVLGSFCKVYSDLASKFPTLKVRYHYASKSSEITISQNLQKKRDELIEIAKELLFEADVTMTFLNARRLLELARTRPETTHSLKTKKYFLDTDAYVVLTPLSSYADFIKNSEGKIRQELFESNVRDFQGSTLVNKDIATTLQTEKVVDFWWMNNGVTILATEITVRNDVLTIENPQIVNGLQTSRQIAEYSGQDPDKQSVMVKVLLSKNDDTRDKIIKAANSQNQIRPASLRATEQIQRDIEDALKSANLYYDRRKNYYKNQGKPRDKIIGISLMAQIIMSIVLAQPDNARARPSSLIKDKESYSKIFSNRYPLLLYVNGAELLCRTQEILRTRPEMKRRDQTNLRFYVLYWVVASAIKSLKPEPREIANLNHGQITNNDIEVAINAVWTLFKKLGGDDNVAKGNQLITCLKKRLAESPGWRLTPKRLSTNSR